MGGKGSDSPSMQDSPLAQAQAERQAQLAAAQQQQVKAAESVPQKVEAPKTDQPPATTATTQTTDTQANLTGLGDQLVSGLSAGRSAQVGDQTARVAANPQTYATQFDPYTGAFVGQGPYNDATTKQGQV